MRTLRLSLFAFLFAAGCGDSNPFPVPQKSFQVVSPSADGAANDARPLVRWTPAAGASRYVVSIYGDAAGTLLLERAETAATEHRCQGALPDGQATYVDVEAIRLGVSLGRTARSRFRVLVPQQSFPEFLLEVPDPSRVAPGYRLFNVFDNGQVGPDDPTYFVLLNTAGEAVWWLGQSDLVGGDVRVLPNGNLLATRTTPAGRGAIEMTWDGQEVWSSPIDPRGAHHEVSVGPNGNYLYLYYVNRPVGNLTYLGDGMKLVDPDTDQVVWEWDIFDHVSTDEVNADDIARDFRGLGQDWTHANAAVWDPDRSVIWVSVRSLDFLLAVDYPSGNIRARIGKGGLGGDGLMSHQHAPQVQPDGTILLFDNGNTRVPPYSSLLIFDWDEGANTVTELYRWRQSPDFYTFAVGDADRLTNGNHLAVDGMNGRLFEVDPGTGDIVWNLQIRDVRWRIYRAEQVTTAEIPPGVLPFD